MIMTKWQDENLTAILEYPFDFERYIEEQLREIDELDERVFAKKVLVEGLGNIIRYTEQKYQDLERRVYQEISIPDNAYEIVSTVIEQKYFDPTNDTLFPVVAMDVDKEECRKALSTEEKVYVGTIYVRADRKRCKSFEEAAFTGRTCMEGRENVYGLQIQKSERYRNVMEHLYKMFQDNHILWETVNIAYLDKFYDVYLPKEELSGEGIDLNHIAIDFGEFDKLIQWDMLPLWNLKQISFDSMNFMVPCIDGIYYEHEFVIEEEGRKDGYLIQINEDISEIRHEKGKIIIKATKENFEKWTAIRMVQKKTVLSLDYTEALLSNRKQDTFIRRYSNESKVSLLTKSELFRKIMELDISEYIEIEDYEILENGTNYPAEESMNWFVRDELFPMEGRKLLLLKFREKEKGNYLNDSMIWFVISQLQTEISEYRCVGTAVLR